MKKWRIVGNKEYDKDLILEDTTGKCELFISIDYDDVNREVVDIQLDNLIEILNNVGDSFWNSKSNNRWDNCDGL